MRDSGAEPLAVTRVLATGVLQPLPPFAAAPTTTSSDEPVPPDSDKPTPAPEVFSDYSVFKRTTTVEPTHHAPTRIKPQPAIRAHKPTTRRRTTTAYGGCAATDAANCSKRFLQPRYYTLRTLKEYPLVWARNITYLFLCGFSRRHE